MGLRGETVGTAYVRILADGSGLPGAIKDEMHKAEPIMEAEGQKHSKAYSDAFDEEMKKSGSKKISKSLNEGIARSDAIEKMFSGSDWKKFLNRMERQFGDVGVLIGHNIQEGVRDSGDLDTISRRLSNISGEVRRAQTQIERTNDAARQEAINFERDFRREMDATTLAFARTVSATGRSAAQIEHAFQRVGDRVSSVRTEVARSGDAMVQSLVRVERRARRVVSGLDGFAAKMGKAFGKGARNNFVNMVGTMVGGFASMIVGGVKAISMLGDFAKKQGQVAGNAEVAASAIGAAGAEVAATGPPGWIALAGIIGGVAFIAPIAAGAISSLAGAVTALGSSLSFGLLAGLGAIAGLLPVIAFGAGTVGAAFIGMNDKTKKALKESLKPAREELTKLQEAARRGSKEGGGGIFGGIKAGAKDMAGVIAKTTPLIRDISDAIGGVIRDFAKAANSEGFKSFIDTMRTFIPDAITTLGRIARNTLGGMGGVFEALIPIAQRFLGWIDRVAAKFSEWANSKKGQDSIKDFMDRAGDSASNLWDLIKKVGEAIGKVLFNDEGRKAGDSIIQDMTDAVQEFIDWLDAHPGVIKKWFADGKKIAEDVGGAIRGIIKVFDALDTPENRAIARLIIGAIVKHLELMAWAFNHSAGPAISAFVKISRALIRLEGTVRGGLANIVDNWLSMVGSFVNGAAKAFGWMPGIGPKLRAAAAKFNTFRAEVTAAIKGIPKDVDIKFTFSGGEKMKQQIAALQWELKKIPRSVTINVLNKVQHIPTAAGAIVGGPQIRLIGEAGPEAVVPLNRPLSQVDPAVRALSAVAQGKASTVTNNSGRTIEVGGLTIITPTKDPAAVAREAVNQLVASSYL